MQTEDILMCPGPNEIADRVLRAMIRPAACPVFDEFQEFYEQTVDMLAQVYQTQNEVIPLPGSGRSGLEAAISSVLERGERSLTIVNGYFGDLAIRIANGVGGKGEAFQEPWGSVLDLDAFAAKLASSQYKLVTMVHNETSSGSLYQQAGEVARLAHDHGALFLLDGVSSLGGAPMHTDAWDVDLAVSCNHKALGAPIGHAHVAVSARAWKTMEQRRESCGTIFGNLLHWKAQPDTTATGGRSKKRPQGVFSAVHLFYAMHEALKMILEEGLETRFTRHELNAAAFREGITGLGLSTIAEPAVASPTVTCVCLPDGISSKAFLHHFRQDHGLATLPGIGDFRERVVRIGHMGVTATPRNILHALHAFDSVLTRLGHQHDRGAAVSRAEEVYMVAEQMVG
jgi:aspartate aminotransferase-like enzyme